MFYLIKNFLKNYSRSCTDDVYDVYDVYDERPDIHWIATHVIPGKLYNYEFYSMIPNPEYDKGISTEPFVVCYSNNPEENGYRKYHVSDIEREILNIFKEYL